MGPASDMDSFGRRQTQPGTEKVKVRVRTMSGDHVFYIAVDSVFVWTRKARQFLNACGNFMADGVGGDSMSSSGFDG